MVTTTRTRGQQRDTMRAKDDKGDDDRRVTTSGKTAAAANSNKRKRESTAAAPKIKAKCSANQPLIDALDELSTAASQCAAQSEDNNKLRYKSAALEKAAMELAKLDDVITSGEPLAAKSSPKKVPGVGKGTAYYIDEFLMKGDISETHAYREQAEKNAQRMLARQNPPQEESTKPITVQINRAPVLTLWVMVVAERQGHTSDEAYTYGRWIAGTFAQSKGRSLGIFEPKEQSDQERAAKRRRDEQLGVTHVQVFQHVKIPVVTEANGNHLAISDGRAVNPRQVQFYLERAFGNKLEAVKQAMKYLADSMPPEELRHRAYHLYEQFRPAWKGWGQKGTLELNTIRALAS